MAKLRYVGSTLFKFHDKGEFKSVFPNGVVEVSDERAKKLGADYPGQWEDAKDAAETPGDIKPAASMPEPSNKAAHADVVKAPKSRKRK